MKPLRAVVVAFAVISCVELISAAVGRPIMFPSLAWFAMTTAVGFVGFLGLRRLPHEVFSGGTLQINQLRRVVSSRTYLAVAWSTLMLVCAVLVMCIFTSTQVFSIVVPVIWLAWLASAYAVLTEEVKRDAST